MHSTSDELQLYHYSTLEGLKGIIRNRSLWLTHTSTLNDPTELKYGKDLIISELDQAILNQDEEIIKEFLTALKGDLSRFDEIMYDTYVACFCESDKLLSQWRVYGHKGGGYNLGLEFTSETEFYDVPDQSEKDNHVILRKIVYEPKKQRELISSYISSVVSYANDAIKYFSTHGGLPPNWEIMAAMESANILCDLMLSFKNDVFSEEMEWRLILVRSDDYKANHLKFIEKEEGLIPYFESFICEKLDDKFFFPLRTIRFGPMLDISNTKSALKLLIKKESVSEQSIKLDSNRIRISDAGFSLR